MSNFLVTLAVFLITVIGALFAVPYFIDWNGYRGVFEEEATRLLGREVRVGGAVNLHLLPTPYFRFEKVRIADTSVNLQEPFFRIESLAIKLAIPPMLRGVVEANEIELQRPVLRLALNSNDGWNWQSFGQLLNGAAYLPSNVALTSVKIADGVLALHGPDGTERTRFEGIHGELSSPALNGPYRFRGSFGKGRASRELRVGTAPPEPDGSVRFKATLRSGEKESASTYTLDGRVADLMGKPHVTGELTARLPIAGLWHVPAQSASKPAAASGNDVRPDRGSEPAFDLKATLSADAAGAALPELALGFEQNGRPQLITGALKAEWRDAFTVEMNLASRWLDLDRMAGAGETAGPLDSIIPLALAVRDMLPAEGHSRATFAIDQGNVGHEAVSNLHLSLARSQEKLEIEELRVGLPGGSRGELQGVVSGLPEAPTFDGSLSLRGTSLVRFLGWATANALTFDAKGDGTFGIRSRLTIAPGSAAVHNLIGDLSGTTVRGGIHYRWEGRPEVSLLVESPLLDARTFIPAGSSLTDMLDVILHGPVARQDASPGVGAAKPAWRGAQTDAQIRINAGQLITTSRTYRDVMLELQLKGGRLKLPQLRVTGDDGFNLELEGEVDNAAARPKGILRGVIGAETAQGVASLADLLGIPEPFRPSAGRAKAMAPLHLAGSMSLGTRTPTSADLVLDGELNGAATKLNARFDGGAGGWRTGPSDLTGVVDGADADTIAALLAPGRSSVRATNRMPGRLLVKATGVPAQGLASLASVEAGDLALRFRGQLVAAERGNSATGQLEIRAVDGARLAALAGLVPPLRLEGMPIAGTLEIAANANKMALDKLALQVGESPLTGQISLAPGPSGRRHIEAHLATAELSVAKLLSPLLDQRLATATAAEEAISGRQSAWPDEPFDGAMLDAFEGNISLASKRLLVADGISLAQAGIDIALAAGRIDVTRIEGGCLGGRCNATLQINKATAGVELSGNLRLTGGALQAVAGNAGGTISGEIKFAGRGTSPRSAISVLQGSGTLELGDAKLATLWPGAIALAADTALKTEPDKLPTVVKETVAAGLGGGELPLPDTLKVEIVDGQLSVKPFLIDTTNGRAQGAASLDLRGLIFDSEWRLDPKPAAPGEKPALPTVTVTYRGPIASLGALEPRISTDALERELAVRRMERDVEELERLRKLDEARRREEAERQRRQFEQTPAPVPVAPAAPEPRSATPG